MAIQCVKGCQFKNNFGSKTQGQVGHATINLRLVTLIGNETRKKCTYGINANE